MRVEAIKLEGNQPVNLTGLDADDVLALVQSSYFTWIDIHLDSSSGPELYELLVDRLDFHPATVEDCLQEGSFHQPKIDEEQDYRFATFIYYEHRKGVKLLARELNVYFSATYVITVHRHTCEELLAQIRKFPRVITDYEQRAVLFMHHVLDMVIDSFAIVLHDFSQLSEQLEIAVLKAKRLKKLTGPLFRRPKDQLSDMRGILKLRRSLVRLRRTLVEEELIVDALVDEYDYDDAPEESKEIAIYFRDVSDHIGKYLEIIEGLESTMNHLMEVHALITSHRTNEIIYLLTIVSAIMLPLNLIVGFFGMNFDNLWLTHNWWGIWTVTLLMVGIVFMLFFFFRAKEWI